MTTLRFKRYVVPKSVKLLIYFCGLKIPIFRPPKHSFRQTLCCAYFLSRDLLDFVSPSMALT